MVELNTASGDGVPADDNPPTDPVQGDPWIDTSYPRPVLKVYDGSAWRIDNATGWEVIDRESFNLTNSYYTYNFPAGYDVYRVHCWDVGVLDDTDSPSNCYLYINGDDSNNNYYVRERDGTTVTGTSVMTVLEWGNIEPTYNGEINFYPSQENVRISLEETGYRPGDIAGVNAAQTTVDSFSIGRAISGYTTFGEVEILGRNLV